MNTPDIPTPVQPGPPDAVTIRTWLLQYVSALLQMPPEDISADDPLGAYGLDSSGAVGLAGDLSSWIGVKLEPDILYNFPTVNALTAHLTEGTR